MRLQKVLPFPALRDVRKTRDLFGGAVPRVLYSGIVVAAVVPLRTLFYTGLRDFIILEGIFAPT